MKLAEALAERAEATRRYEQLQQRLYRTAQVQEGDVPPEDPLELLSEANGILARIEFLIRRINATNSATPFDHSLSLTDAIARRDVLLKRRALYATLADRASAVQNRYSRSEVKFVATVNVRDTQRAADHLAADYRALDTAIQRLNWEADLL